MSDTLSTQAAFALAAILLDAVVGDPKGLTHPVMLIGRLIAALEARWRRPAHPVWRQRLGGMAVAALVPVAAAGAVYSIGWAAGKVHPWLASLSLAWLASTTVAAKGLAQAGRSVERALLSNDLALARRRVGEIVGRDTENLSEPEVCRAAVETVAENIVDAITAPLFYAFLGGAPLAMAYRAVNTLDSMLGYKNEKYRWFGWASARLDDVANWVPARLTAVLLSLAAALNGLDGGRAWRTIWRDAHRHPSPNSGIPEAGVAGALGVQLGGVNYYQGVAQYRATMGELLVPLEAAHIGATIRLMWTVTALCAMIAALVFVVAGR